MFFLYAKKLMKGQTILRTMMNYGLSNYSISGSVADIGGGRSPDYFKYMKVAPGTAITPIDGSMNPIDFEKDPLPDEDGSRDVVISCNVLEHIYNHRFLVGEMKRILKPGGKLIGFVPFLINYHPDPHDYFRYTKEALVKILGEFKNVEVKEVGMGPLCVNLNNIILYFPKNIRPFPFFFAYFFDRLWLKLRPDITSRYPLGYIFSATK